MKLNLRRLITWLSNDIVSRTKLGYDKNRRPFLPYTDNYAKKKGSKTVNLTLSGLMLGSYKPINETDIGFTNAVAQKRAEYNAGMGRLFIGIDDRQMKYINDYVHKEVDKEASKWLKTL